MGRQKIFLKALLIGALFAVPTATFFSCGQQPKTACQLKTVDQYYHQYKWAMEYTDQGRYKAADKKLVTIFQCDKKFAPAYAALAWLRSHAYKAEIDPNVKKTIWKEVKDALKKSLKYAKNDSQKFIGHVTAIRVYTLTKVNDWLDEARDHFDEAVDLKHLDSRYLPYYRGKVAAYYYMGLAYYEADKYDQAAKMLKKALSLAPTGRYVRAAEKLLKKIQLIEEVESRYSIGDIGKVIAKKDKITRAELVALLVDELHLPELFLKRFGANLKLKPSIHTIDIENNPYKQEIEAILKLGIRGLQPIYSQKYQARLFEPDKPVTRCELAMILEDIYAKLTKNPSITTKYMGMTNSPFKDLPTYNGCFNAMMNAVTMGWLPQPENGYVHPNEPVSGAEALYAVYKLRDILFQTP